MKKFEFNKDRWLHTFYKATFNQDANQNFCDYFWALVGAFITLPITWYAYVLQLLFSLRTSIEVKREGYWTDASEWVTTQTTSRVRTFSENFYRLNGKWWSKFWIGLIGQAVTIGVVRGFITNPLGGLKWTVLIIAAVAILAAFYVIMTKIEKSSANQKLKENISEIKNTVTAGYKSFKEKHCPRITWVTDTDLEKKESDEVKNNPS